MGKMGAIQSTNYMNYNIHCAGSYQCTRKVYLIDMVIRKYLLRHLEIGIALPGAPSLFCNIPNVCRTYT